MKSVDYRKLLVIADDFGIGHETTAGILQLASSGLVTGSALLVNGPATIDGLNLWRRLGSTLELGWHPNLVLDRPVARPDQVPTLVQADGTFWPRRSLLQRSFFGKLNPREIELELSLQLDRFIELVGHEPTFVNFHQHIALFSPFGRIALKVLNRLSKRPYFRRVKEPWLLQRRLSGARFKRFMLTLLGRHFNRLLDAGGFPGNDWLVGIANPRCLKDSQFFVNRLKNVTGNVVELMCHPGKLDQSLMGRDCTESDGVMHQRVNEMRWLSDPGFLQTVKGEGFRLTAPSEVPADAKPLVKNC